MDYAVYRHTSYFFRESDVSAFGAVGQQLTSYLMVTDPAQCIAASSVSVKVLKTILCAWWVGE